MKLAIGLCCLGLLVTNAAASANAPPIAVVAAENFYGDIARQIGGEAADVTSILTNPDQDPHLFEASPSVARAVSGARIVILNGIDYDPWMDKLLGAARSPGRIVIDAASLAGRAAGVNPHIWYDPQTMLAVARAVATAYEAADPARTAMFAARLGRFEASLVPIQQRIALLRGQLHGVAVTATEPVFGYMLAALGMVSRNQGFQRAVMNGTEASASDIAAFEHDLRAHRVRLLIYNAQASDTIADRMKAIAASAGVPIMAATETEPRGATYQAWIQGELDALEHALAAVH